MLGECKERERKKERKKEIEREPHTTHKTSATYRILLLSDGSEIGRAGLDNLAELIDNGVQSLLQFLSADKACFGCLGLWVMELIRRTKEEE